MQVARYLGAAGILATGRSQHALAELSSLGADQTISLLQPEQALLEAFRSAFHQSRVNIVLDYLWGTSAELLLKAAAGHGAAAGETRIRFVQIGAMSGHSIFLPAQALRSSGLELLGSGLGSLSVPQILAALTRMFAASAQVPFPIATEPVPLHDVEAAWTRPSGDRRIVFLPAFGS